MKENFLDFIIDGKVETDVSLDLYLIDSDKLFGADLKDAEYQSFPEEDGRRVLINPNMKEFTYKFTMLCFDVDVDRANDKIVPLYERIRGKEIGIVNKHAQIEIWGHVRKAPEPKQFDRSVLCSVREIVSVEFEIEVNDPGKCNFNKK